VTTWETLNGANRDSVPPFNTSSIAVVINERGLVNGMPVGLLDLGPSALLDHELGDSLQGDGGHGLVNLAVFVLGAGFRRLK